MNILLTAITVSSLVMGGQGLTLEAARPVAEVEVIEVTPLAPIEPAPVITDMGHGGGLGVSYHVWCDELPAGYPMAWPYCLPRPVAQEAQMATVTVQAEPADDLGSAIKDLKIFAENGLSIVPILQRILLILGSH
jgi:hypothetical protein